MYRILLPVDTNDDRAIDAAEYVIELPVDRSEVTVILLNVFEDFEYADDSGTVIESEDLYNPDSFPESVESAELYLEENGISVETHRKHGSPAKMIIEAVDDIGADQIVMGARKRSPVGKALFGSVTQAVLLGADVPVTVVG